MRLPIPSMLPSPDKARQYAPDIYGNEIVTYRTTYTEKAEGMPQIVLVEQPDPGSVLLPHYHASDQFQLFLDGSGTLGAHAITPVSIHYTNRYTGYGPIAAGPEGLTYYVLRPSVDVLGPGQYLFRPELREKAKTYKGKKRTFVADGVNVRGVDELRNITQAEVVRLFGTGEDEPDAGTFAETVCIGPKTSYTGQDPKSGGGQVFFVLQGSVIDKERELGPRSAIAVTKEESPLQVHAGAEGVQLLVMQYPRW